MPSSRPIPFPTRVPFVESLGAELHVFADGVSELRLTLAERHLNSGDVAHGGVVMTLLDVAMAFAARCANADSVAVATIEMKTTFMQPCIGLLTGKGRLMHRTRSMAFTEGTIHDSEGKACAHATGTFKYVKRQPAGRDVISTD